MKLGPNFGWRSVARLLRLKDKTAINFCLFPKANSAGYGPGRSPVYLNVYDLTPVNGYMYWAGLGIFHSGVEVHGVECAFGAHEYPASGVFEVVPRQCPGFTFRKSIFIGTTCLDSDEVREFMELQAANYNGDSYNLTLKNCNHFCEDICYKLTGNSIPRWVNRMARIGSKCNCILPESFKAPAVQKDTEFRERDSEKKRLRSAFSCLSSMSMHVHRKKVSMSSSFLHSHCFPPWYLRKCRKSLKKV